MKRKIGNGRPDAVWRAIIGRCWRSFACRLRNRTSNAFTLIELMVVFGMLAILMGVAFSGIGQARQQARIAKANAEVRELMNAWLSYEAAHDDWPSGFTFGDAELKASRANLKELIGEGEEETVYLNAKFVNDYFVDPWGNPYQFRLRKTTDSSQSETFGASIAFPNRSRMLQFGP